MSRRIARWLAWSLFALTVALSLGILPLFVAVTSAGSALGTPLPPQAAAQLQASPLGWLGTLVGLVACWAFAGLGAVIVSRYPAHTIGWIFCAIGFLIVVEPCAGYYAIYTLFVSPGALPGGLLAGWFQNWIWVVSAALLCAFLPLLFPTGRLLSRRWKSAWWLITGATIAGALGAAFHSGPLFNSLEGFDVPNPFGVAGLGGLFLVLGIVPFGLLLASMLVAAGSLVVRLRRARGEERQQIKWFGYFGVVLALLFVLQFVVRYILGISSPPFDAGFSLSWSVALIGLPLATGLAILRYRLFDIDVLIRRTLVYGTLTASLAALYFGLVVGLQTLMGSVNIAAASSPVVIVATTLLIAALFNPLRHGIQAAIDLSFYRRKYDAAKTLQAFSATLRSEVELEQVQERLLAVVKETMQPAHVSLWVRVPQRGASGARSPAAATFESRGQSGNVRAV
jgi:hypothetical protein